MEPSYDLNVESVEDGQGIVRTWLSCLVYCAITFVMFYFAVRVFRDGVAILVTGFFAAFGVAYIVVAIRHTISRATFGDVKLLMEHPAPSVGGRLAGSVTLPRSALAAPTLVAELTCERETFGDKSDTRTETMWCGKHSFPIHRKPGGGSARIAIDIPASLEPTTARPETVSWSLGQPPKVFWSWMLKVTVDLPGVDLDRSYPVRVLPALPGVVAAAAAAKEARAETRTQAVQVAREPEARSQMHPPVQVPVFVETQAAPEVRERDGTSVWALVAANLVPIVGALYWGWAAEDIIFLYWIENLVIGAFNVPRILLAEPELGAAADREFPPAAGAMLAGKAMLAAFFVVHFGGFCFVHGEFLVSMFGGAHRSDGLGDAVRTVLGERGMWLAVLAIVASRAYSFFRNYIGQREYEGIDARELMVRPYKRIFVTHIFIIAGGFLLTMTKLPAAALVLFIAVKIGADAYFHRAEREAFGAAPAAG